LIFCCSGGKTSSFFSSRLRSFPQSRPSRSPAAPVYRHTGVVILLFVPAPSPVSACHSLAALPIAFCTHFTLRSSAPPSGMNFLRLQDRVPLSVSRSTRYSLLFNTIILFRLASPPRSIFGKLSSEVGGRPILCLCGLPLARVQLHLHRAARELYGFRGSCSIFNKTHSFSYLLSD